MIGGSRRRLLSVAGRLCLLLLPLSSAAPATFQNSPLWQAWTMVEIADYVVMSAGRGAVNRDRYVIGVMGNDEVRRYLGEVLKDKGVKQIQRRPVEVVEIKPAEAAAKARTVDLLFVGAAGEAAVRPVLKKCADAGVVTIGETKGFTAAGGVFRFDVDARKLIYHRANLDGAPYGLHRRFRRYMPSE